jgi:Flp pilus assembly protein TadG
VTRLQRWLDDRLRSDAEAGNAVLEFVVLAVLLLIPLVYVMLAVLRVQGAAYGIADATREAGRAFVAADTSSEAYARACTAATIAMRDQVDDAFDCATQLSISCVGECSPSLSPGDTIRVEIDLPVALPMLPTSVFGNPTAISLTSVHDEVVDEFRSPR